MTRIAFGSMMIAFGYLLVFAGFTEGGKYALRPWGALHG